MLRLMIFSLTQLIVVLPLVKSMRLSFELPDGERMCFYENLNSTVKYIFEYQVISGGSYDVDVHVTNTNNAEIYRQVKSSYGTLYLVAKGKKANVPEISGTVSYEHMGGHYRFCFSNKFSVVTHKRVYMGLLSESDLMLPSQGLKDTAEVASLTQLEYSLSAIAAALSSVENTQMYFQLHASRHRSFARELNSRVSFYSFVYAVALIVVSLSQVMVLRSFFTEKAGQRNVRVQT